MLLVVDECNDLGVLTISTIGCNMCIHLFVLVTLGLGVIIVCRLTNTLLLLILKHDLLIYLLDVL